MAARLGNVLFWTSILIAGGWVWLNYDLGQQNAAITWGGAGLAYLVGRYVLGGAKLDDDKKQLEVKSKRLEAKSETESVPLKEEDVLKAQVAFEERLEGYRMPGDVRAGNDFSGRFPFIAMAVSKLPVRSCLIDGEACVCDENGLAVFDLIRRHGALANAVLCAFDLLELDYRFETARLTLPLRAFSALGEGQKPESAGCEAGSRRRLGSMRSGG